MAMDVVSGVLTSGTAKAVCRRLQADRFYDAIEMISYIHE
jgi:hypothetical protein